MHRTYGSLFPFIVYIQRIKIRCYNINRGYASSCNTTRAVGSTHFATPGFNPVHRRRHRNKSHGLDPSCAYRRLKSVVTISNKQGLLL